MVVSLFHCLLISKPCAINCVLYISVLSYINSLNHVDMPATLENLILSLDMTKLITSV